MAGIGFELRRLSREGGLLRPVASAGHGAFVVAGPWLLTVLALKIVQHGFAGARAEAGDLQAVIIYTFCLSLVLTAPLIAAGLRLCADELYLERPERVRGTYLATQCACLPLVALGALLLFGLGFGWRGPALAAGVAATGAIGAIWPATAFSNAMRDYGTITRAFVFGLAVAAGATLLAARLGLGAPIETLAFASGLWITALWLTAGILSAFPSPVTRLRAPLGRLAQTLAVRWPAAAGALAAAAAIWVDSWFFWSGTGRVSASGLPTAPFYDSAMFVARLSMVPGLVLFVTSVDTGVFTALRRLLETIEAHGTLAQVEAEGRALEDETGRLLMRLVLLQGLASGIALLLTPALVEPFGLLYQQVTLLRYGVAGAFFNTIFFVATALLTLLGRDRLFLALQLLFLGLNAGAAGATLALGPDSHGFGYLAAAALSSVAAVLSLHSVLGQLVSLVFDSALHPLPVPRLVPRQAATALARWRALRRVLAPLRKVSP